jgi:uncharacterized protein YraI
MRKTPSSDAEEVGQIPVGETVGYQDEQFGWLKCTFNGATGWVSGTFVDRPQQP